MGMSVGDPPMNALVVELEKLADVYDAVGDLMLAEAVHQTVAGHPERAQAATRFLDRQEVPVEPDVSATPRRAHSFVHRYAVALGPPAPGSPWAALAAGDPRAAAEPRLDAWVGTLLGDPALWSFTGRTIAADGTVGATETVTPGDLGLGPLALVAAATTGGGDQPSELEQRVARVIAGAPRGRQRHRAADDLGRLPRAGRARRPGRARSGGCCAPRGPATHGSSTCRTARRPVASTRSSSPGVPALPRSACATRRPRSTPRWPPTHRRPGGWPRRSSRSAAPACPSAVAPVGLFHGAPTEPAGAGELDLAKAVAAAVRARVARLDVLGDDGTETSSRSAPRRRVRRAVPGARHVRRADRARAAAGGAACRPR